MKPNVSVVMPVFNSAATLSDAALSVLSQTYKNFELIIVDDGSEDSTRHLLRDIADMDGRVRVHRNQTNQGISFSRNLGVNIALGEWVAFIDSDDMWKPDKLEKQLMFIDEHQAVFSYTASTFMNKNGVSYGYVMPAEFKTNYDLLLKSNLISCSSVIAKREILARHPMPDDRMHEDYAAWLSVLREVGHAYGLDEPLLIYRIASGSKSSGRLRSARMIFNTYIHAGYKSPVSLLLTIRYAAYSIKKRRKIIASGIS